MAKRSKTRRNIQRKRRGENPSKSNTAAPSDLTTALQLQQTGQFERAKELYCKLLERDPQNVDAWHFLGMTFYAVNQFQTALECLLKADGLAPNQPALLANLGLVFRGLGDLTQAAKSLQRAVKLEPNFLNARSNLGTVLLEQKKTEQAVQQFEFVLAVEPNQENALMNLGNLRQTQGRFRDAERLYRQGIQHHPHNGRMYNNLGQTLRNQGQLKSAVDAFHRAVEIEPSSLESQLNLGRTLVDLKRHDDAIQILQTLVAQHPKQAKPHHYLGKACYESGATTDAIEHIRYALELDPHDVHARCSLGFAYLDSGHSDQAEACFRDATARDPSHVSAHSSLLFVMSGNLELDQQTLFEEHQRWGRLHGSVDPLGPHLNHRTVDRRLRVGYVSPDLRRHAVASFFKPVLANHDPTCVETYCYSEAAVPDDMTESLRGLADHWRNTNGLSDEQVATQVMSDQIDILVDLAGHTAKNRLSAFAFRPAPVQVTWMGYPNTTGLTTVDYRLTCDIQNPVAEPSYHTEQLLRMKFGSFCYTPPAIAPTIKSSPLVRNGFVTLGSLHRPFKITPPVRELWANVMLSMPESRLILFNTRFSEQSAATVSHDLIERGVERDRIEIRNQTIGETYLTLYDEIDIGLDVTPWAGGTTTIEALWMGVPVVALYGDRRSARSTAAILNQVGLADLIAQSAEHYVRLIAELAHNRARLESLRNDLRPTLERTICNGQRFTNELEQVYRTMWHRWCAST